MFVRYIQQNKYASVRKRHDKLQQVRGRHFSQVYKACNTRCHMLALDWLTPMPRGDVAPKRGPLLFGARRSDVFQLTSCRRDTVVTRGDDTATWSHATRSSCCDDGVASCNVATTSILHRTASVFSVAIVLRHERYAYMGRLHTFFITCSDRRLPVFRPRLKQRNYRKTTYRTLLSPE